MGSSLLDWNRTLAKDRGCHHLECLIICRGRVIPEAKVTFFPLLWLECVALPVCLLGFRKPVHLILIWSLSILCILYVFPVCGY